MSVAIITGSTGLVGSEAVAYFSRYFDTVVGLDNDTRANLFGPTASTKKTKDVLCAKYDNYKHYSVDIRDSEWVGNIFNTYNTDIKLIIHAAAQPSHDWAASDPLQDWNINATATLNLLEYTRHYCPDAVFIFCSTNKVYGDVPNRFNYTEGEKRIEAPFWSTGFNEELTIDYCTHSLFGCSKLAADILTQEYGRYFGIKTGIFRCGCITGPNHSGAEQHGFLSYLVKCAVENKPYTIYGYGGKQVRDNIHAYDLVSAFHHFYKHPRTAEVYNMGGGPNNSCSVLEAIDLVEEITGNKLRVTVSDQVRKGDHRWYISDVSKFKDHYRSWEYKYSLKETIKQIYDSCK